MASKKITCTWNIDGDIAEIFDEVVEETGMAKGISVQVALWAYMHLTPGQRQAAHSAMKSRTAWPNDPTDANSNLPNADEEWLKGLASRMKARRKGKASAG